MPSINSLINAPLILFFSYFSIFLVHFFYPTGLSAANYTNTYYSYMGSVFFSFIIFYYIGSLFAVRIIRNIFNEGNDVGASHNINKLSNIYLVICFVGLSLYAFNLLTLPTRHFFSLEEMRSLLTVDLESTSIPLEFLFTPFFFCLGPFLVMNYQEIGFKKTSLFILLLMVFFVFSLSRSTIFVSCLMTFYASVFHTKKNNTSILNGLFFLLILFFCFKFFGILMGKMSNQSTFLYYIIEPSHALDKIINNQADQLKGYFLTFRPLHPILLKFGLIEQKATILPNFYNDLSGGTTNVFTMFGVYINDYGIYGSLMIVSIIGFFSGILDKLHHLYKKNKIFILMLSLNLTCLTLGIFYDYYLSSGFTWLIFLFSFCYIFFSRHFKHEMRHVDIKK